MDVPTHLQYTRNHDWIEVRTASSVRIGVSDFAQDLLGVIVFIELPELDTVLEVGESYGCLESVKTVTDLYSPLKGRVIAINEKLKANPEIVNVSPYTEGWLIELQIFSDELVKLSEAALHFLSANEYETFIGHKST
jgi:glycine cleavage system H protein